MEDFEKRKEEFLKRYKDMVDELKCDVASGPNFVPIGGGAFCVMMTKEVIDLENAPVPSPFQS